MTVSKPQVYKIMPRGGGGVGRKWEGVEDFMTSYCSCNRLKKKIPQNQSQTKTKQKNPLTKQTNKTNKQSNKQTKSRSKTTQQPPHNSQPFCGSLVDLGVFWSTLLERAPLQPTYLTARVHHQHSSNLNNSEAENQKQTLRLAIKTGNKEALKNYCYF